MLSCPDVIFLPCGSLTVANEESVQQYRILDMMQEFSWFCLNIFLREKLCLCQNLVLALEEALPCRGRKNLQVFPTSNRIQALTGQNACIVTCANAKKAFGNYNGCL